MKKGKDFTHLSPVLLGSKWEHVFFLFIDYVKHEVRV